MADYLARRQVMDQSRERKTELALDVGTVAVWEIGKKLITSLTQKGAEKTAEHIEKISTRDQAEDRARFDSEILKLESEDPDAYANWCNELQRRQKLNDGSEAKLVNSMIELYRVNHPNEFNSKQIWDGNVKVYVDNPKYRDETEAGYRHQVWREGLGIMGHDIEHVETHVEAMFDDRLEQFMGRAAIHTKKALDEFHAFNLGNPAVQRARARRLKRGSSATTSQKQPGFLNRLKKHIDDIIEDIVKE